MWRRSVCCQEKTNKQLKSAEIKGFREKVLHDAVITAVNDTFAQKNMVIPLLKQTSTRL